MKVKTTRIEVFQGLMKVLADLFEEGKMVFSSTIFSCGISKDRTNLFVVNFEEGFFDVEESSAMTIGVNFTDVHKTIARFRDFDKISIEVKDEKRFKVSGEKQGMKKGIILKGYMSDTVKRVDLGYVNGVISNILNNSVMQATIDGDNFKEMIGDSSILNEDVKLKGVIEKRILVFKAVADSGAIEYEKRVTLEEGEFMIRDFSKTYRIEMLKEFERAGWIHDFKINIGETCMLVSADVYDKGKKKPGENVIGRIMLVMSSKA